VCAGNARWFSADRASSRRGCEREKGGGGGRTDEHEGIGHVVVAHVDNGRAHPATEALLRTVENRVHHAVGLWRWLHAV